MPLAKVVNFLYINNYWCCGRYKIIKKESDAGNFMIRIAFLKNLKLHQ